MHSPITVRVTDSTVDVLIVDAHLNEVNVESLGSQLDELAGQAGKNTLRLDFGGVKYLTSTVLGKLISLHTRVKGAGGHFQVVNLGPDLYDMFTVTRLNTFIDVQPMEGPQPRLAV